jgi:hypothetical protein
VKIIFFLFVITPLLFIFSLQDSFSQLAVDTKCNDDHVLVLRTNVQKYACVFDSTATIWANHGIAELVAQTQPTQDTLEEPEAEIFALIPFGDESSKKDDLIVQVPDTEIQQQVESQLDILLYKISQMKELASKTEIVNAVIDSNKNFAAMKDIALYITQKDQEWIDTPKNILTPFMGALIENNISDILREKSTIPTEQFGDILFPEIIITNVYGANVAQSIRTEDYNQADEGWWIRAKSETVQIREVSWDESAGIYSADIIVRIVDEQGNFIGVLNAATPIRDV